MRVGQNEKKVLMLRASIKLLSLNKAEEYMVAAWDYLSEDCSALGYTSGRRNDGAESPVVE